MPPSSLSCSLSSGCPPSAASGRRWFLGYKVKRGPGLRLPAYKRKTVTNPHNLYAVPREKSVQRFREQIRNLTCRCAPVRLSAMIEVLNPVIRGWGNYYRKANVRTLFHRLD